MENHAKSKVSQWLQDPVIINAIKAQNQANAGMGQGQIDALDKQWRAEVSAPKHPLIDGVLNNALSAFLKAKEKASNGLYSEIFVMDNHGLNVGQSEITSDYWQGDEAKWQKTYSVGPGSMHISEVEQDESTQTYQSQLSLPITDPANGAVIGAITIGINVEAL
ncbi:MAG: hypothetical protein H7A09_00815 [Oceanospirillaceae bacterium]|nr:hypothetical protein [Oceanospirillaceae bacterium]MCP5335599.1 hypothetical protein [Oceanospirillaceae bacterium]